MKTIQRRKKEDCQWFNEFDELITCDNPKLIVCVCIKVCKEFKLHIKPYSEL